MIARNILAVIIGAAVLIALFAWKTGQASTDTVGMMTIGLLFLATFYFVASLLFRLPFLRLRSALASLLSIVLVLLGLLYALPLIEQYRQGYDVSRSLLHPMVFAALALGIVLLTLRR